MKNHKKNALSSIGMTTWNSAITESPLPMSHRPKTGALETHARAASIQAERMIKDTSKRTRRLRKKLRVDEFRIMGFEVTVSLRDSLSMEEGNAFWDRFILEAIEQRGLQYGGLAEGYAMREADVSATDEDRGHVQAWLVSQPEVTGCDIGQLSDAYGARGPWFTVPPARQCTPAMKRRHWAKFRRIML